MASSKLSRSNSTFYFPENLIFAILSRLPVKSLIRFAVVCKTWYSLIQNPSFISEHLKQSKLNPNLDMSFLLVTNFKYHPRRCTLWSHKIDGSYDRPIKLNFPFLGETELLTIVGVCNGLACLSLSEDEFNVVICNLATMKFHRVPNCGFWTFLSGRVHPWLASGEVLVGFMYDPDSDDYMLITMMYYLDCLVDHVEIYTMKTNSWREIDLKIPFRADVFTCSCIPSATIDGVFYWEGLKGPLDDVVILSFNMSDMVFRVIDGPMRYSGMWDDLNWEFFDVNEEIAIVIYSDERCFDVWVPNENGSCWNKKFKIGPLPTVGTHPTDMGIGRITLTVCDKNDNFIIQDITMGEVRLFSYDNRSQELKILPFTPLDSSYGVYLYTESLLPVPKNI